MNRGSVSEFIDDFERGSFLAFDAKRVDRIHDTEIAAIPELDDDAQRVIEVSVDRNDARRAKVWASLPEAILPAGKTTRAGRLALAA